MPKPQKDVSGDLGSWLRTQEGTVSNAFGLSGSLATSIHDRHGHNCVASGIAIVQL